MSATLYYCISRGSGSPGSSTDSAINECARHVGRMESSILLHQADVLHVAVIGNVSPVVGSTHNRCRFQEFEVREHEGAFLLTQSVLQIIASRVAMEPSDKCT
jgi:hypothetical protein